MLTIEDQDLPGLADLSQTRLCEITGAEHVGLLRLRYREGKRAILHVTIQMGKTRTEGALWFFKGDKAKRIARRNKTTARYDPQTQALFEGFPHDHRMPQIHAFLENSSGILRDLAGASLTGAPILLRYRPGLSCTFRCAVDSGASVYVKLINDDDPARILHANRSLLKHFKDGAVTVAPALGINSPVSAIAYGAAPGRPLDDILADGVVGPPIEQAVSAIQTFWQAPITPERHMGPERLLTRARESADFVAAIAPSCHDVTRKIVLRLADTIPDSDLMPIHGDMKLEHVFLDAGRTTLIDTESVSLGLPDYDLAQLYGRLWQAESEELLACDRAIEASAYVRSRAGPAFGWCLDVVALRLAKFYAQRPATEMTHKITAILDRLT